MMNMSLPVYTTEAKYPFHLEHEPIVRSILDSMCMRDGEYPEDRINSIYFDTRDLKHLAEKVDSDYVKTKVRLRWYGNIELLDPDQNINAFLEVKIKNGVRRQKSRHPINVKAGLLNNAANSFDELMELVIYARECGWEPCGQLFPTLMISYDRIRYLDPQDLARVALDRYISCKLVNSIFWAPAPSSQLSQGVLEVKSQSGTLPRALWLIREKLCMRDSFSKYEECWQSYMDPLYERNLRSANVD